MFLKLTCAPESGELTTGEPCTPYIINKSIVNSSGELEARPDICDRKIPLLELRKKLLVKQENYAIAEVKAYQTKRNLGIWHDHSTILRNSYTIPTKAINPMRPEEGVWYNYFKAYHGNASALLW